MEKEQFRRRYILTINNPFWNKDNKELENIDKDKIDENFFDLSYVNDYKDLFEFHYQYTTDKTKIVYRPYFKDVDCAIKYVEKLEHIKYSVFQVEKGSSNETEHIQMFLIFTIGKRFSTIKKLFPTAHFEECKGNNVQCRDYCSKSDTRVSGPYEIGQFAEQRSRTDIKNFFELLDSGVSDLEIRELYPSLYLKEFKKISELRMARKKEIYSKQKRDVEVTFVYGPSGVGKSTYVDNLIQGEDCFRVDTFDNSAFTGYSGEDILLIDEFKGQFNIQFMNRLLDCFPIKLRGLGSLIQACFTKVYIISNFSYRELYKSEQEENSGQYAGFVRRLHKIVRIDNSHKTFIERETVFEDIPKEKRSEFGKTKEVKQMVEYDKLGFPCVVYDKNRIIQLEILSQKDSAELDEIFI